LNWELWSQQERAEPMFTGLLAYDNFTLFVRLFLLAFTILVIWLTILTGIPDQEDSADFYSLLLGAVVGMSLMASANHLLMVFIGVEMASLPSYALAGFLKGKRQSSEAALKYVVYGGGASGVMLYGISLLAGKFGTAYMPDLAAGITAAFKATSGPDPILLLGMLLVLVGFAFKVSAVPFHFWCPDVFEGAAAEVAAFLSVACKGAGLALLGRLAFAVVAFLRNQTGSEDLSSYRGLMQRAPVMAVTLGVFLFSLLGIPPLIGFAAKFQIFYALFEAGKLYSHAHPPRSGLSFTMYA